MSSLFVNHININAITNNEFTYDRVKNISDWILNRVDLRPKIAIVCGSGLGGLGERVQDARIFPYEEIPDFPRSTVVGHKGNLIVGKLNEIPVICMQGRFHSYEGYSNALCTLPMKVFKLMGVQTVLLTCAAGGLNQSFKVGDIMLIKDHVAPLLWTLQNPLIGHNDERFGPRFPACNNIYKKNLRDIFRSIAEEKQIELQEGNYAYLGGPNYETVTELKALIQMGGDAVGASTANEALVASYCGMNVLAIALITNKAVIEYDSQDFPCHEEVIQIANQKACVLQELVTELVKFLDF
ncbi:unnamed protein product [Brachionus calyciflorus]|uniref:Purine nucleoside phosphorylase n=1 Tax=Brachionus calyciflorus TaxID=104777 RepID=A0A813SI05_9BILA|nr:unnamed protein product [Brachionus calyciflorus]